MLGCKSTVYHNSSRLTTNDDVRCPPLFSTLFGTERRSSRVEAISDVTCIQEPLEVGGQCLQDLQWFSVPMG